MKPLKTEEFMDSMNVYVATNYGPVLPNVTEILFFSVFFVFFTFS